MDVSLATVGVSEEKMLTQISSFENYQDFISAGLTARSYKDKSQWLLGALALGVESKFGESSLKKYAKEIGVSVSSLNIYRWVVSKYTKDKPDFVPSGSLPFSILQEAASLEEPAREEILRQAEENGMSVEMVRVKTQQAKGKVIRPRFTVSLCKLHNKWYFVPSKIQEWEAAHET